MITMRCRNSLNGRADAMDDARASFIYAAASGARRGHLNFDYIDANLVTG